MEPHSLSLLHPCPVGPGGLPAQRPAQPDSLGGSVWSLQGSTAPLLLFPLTQVLPFAGQPPTAPWSAGGHPCPILAASPCSQLRGVGSGQVVRRIIREAGRVCACGQHLPLTWDRPLFSCHFLPLRAAPLNAPPPSITSAPVALLWIRVTREGVRMQSPRLQPQRTDPTSQWIGLQGFL